MAKGGSSGGGIGGGARGGGFGGSRGGGAAVASRGGARSGARGVGFGGAGKEGLSKGTPDATFSSRGLARFNNVDSRGGRPGNFNRAQVRPMTLRDVAPQMREGPVPRAAAREAIQNIGRERVGRSIPRRMTKAQFESRFAPYNPNFAPPHEGPVAPHVAQKAVGRMQLPEGRAKSQPRMFPERMTKAQFETRFQPYRVSPQVKERPASREAIQRAFPELKVQAQQKSRERIPGPVIASDRREAKQSQPIKKQAQRSEAFPSSQKMTKTQFETQFRPMGYAEINKLRKASELSKMQGRVTVLADAGVFANRTRQERAVFQTKTPEKKAVRLESPVLRTPPLTKGEGGISRAKNFREKLAENPTRKAEVRYTRINNASDKTNGLEKKYPVLRPERRKQEQNVTRPEILARRKTDLRPFEVQIRKSQAQIKENERIQQQAQVVLKRWEDMVGTKAWQAGERQIAEKKVQQALAKRQEQAGAAPQKNEKGGLSVITRTQPLEIPVQKPVTRPMPTVEEQMKAIRQLLAEEIATKNQVATRLAQQEQTKLKTDARPLPVPQSVAQEQQQRLNTPIPLQSPEEEGVIFQQEKKEVRRPPVICFKEDLRQLQLEGGLAGYTEDTLNVVGKIVADEKDEELAPKIVPGVVFPKKEMAGSAHRAGEAEICPQCLNFLAQRRLTIAIHQL